MRGDAAQLILETGFALWLGAAGRSEFLAPAFNGQRRQPSCPEKGTEALGLACVMITLASAETYRRWCRAQVRFRSKRTFRKRCGLGGEGGLRDRFGREIVGCRLQPKIMARTTEIAYSPANQ